MKVFIWTTHRSCPFHSGVLFYNEAKKQGLDVHIGVTLDEIKKCNPDWVFLSSRGHATPIRGGRHDLVFENIMNVQKICEKMFLWDDDDVCRPPHYSFFTVTKNKFKIFVTTYLGIAEEFKDYAEIVKFIPHHYYLDYCKPTIETLKKKIYDVAHIGFCTKERAGWLGHLAQKRSLVSIGSGTKHIPKVGKRSINKVERLTGSVASNYYLRSKIGLQLLREPDTCANQERDLWDFYHSSRTQHIMGIGTFLLTHKIKKLEQVFEDGKHLVTYSDRNDMMKKIEYYLKNNEERDKIALAGQKEILKKHTVTHRIKEFWKLMEGYDNRS